MDIPQQFSWYGPRSLEELTRGSLCICSTGLVNCVYEASREQCRLTTSSLSHRSLDSADGVGGELDVALGGAVVGACPFCNDPPDTADVAGKEDVGCIITVLEDVTADVLVDGVEPFEVAPEGDEMLKPGGASEATKTVLASRYKQAKKSPNLRDKKSELS